MRKTSKVKKTKAIEGEVIRKDRKTKYEPWMCEKIIEAAKQGKHVAGMCVAIGINSRDTFYRWLNEYEDFDQAYKESKLMSQDFYEDVGLAGMLGKIKNFNFNSWVTTMNNKFSDEYKRNATGSNTEINIGSINTIEQLNTEQLDEKIESLQERLNLIPEGADEEGPG